MTSTSGETVAPRRRWLNFGREMAVARGLVAIAGVLLPYAARLPGISMHGAKWFTAYWEVGWYGTVFFGMFNAVCWGSIVVATLTYRHVRSVWFPALFGFASRVYQHATLDLAADAQAPIALVFIPFLTLPYVVAGWLVGLAFDKFVFKETAAEAARDDDKFTLRRLLIVVTVVGVALGLLNWFWQHHRARMRESVRQSVLNGELTPEQARPTLGDEVDSFQPAVDRKNASPAAPQAGMDQRPPHP